MGVGIAIRKCCVRNTPHAVILLCFETEPSKVEADIVQICCSMLITDCNDSLVCSACQICHPIDYCLSCSRALLCTLFGVPAYVVPNDNSCYSY